MRRRRWWLAGVFLAGLLAILALLGNDLARAFESRTPSESVGSPGAGRLRHGKRLPTSGTNFRAYSRLGAALGRTAVTDRVPTAPWNKFGYGIEFDSTGRWGKLVIDFPAVAAHLEALAQAAPRHRLRIERVILAPELETRLRALPTTPAAVRRLPFLRGPVWVRHDEHYHVDFGQQP